MNGLRVGRWSIASGTHVLEYDATWLDRDDARPISLSLPLLTPGESHRGSEVESFFENLLPENDDLRARLRRNFGARSNEAFDLLACIGDDCAGALQLHPPDRPPGDAFSIQGEPLDEADIANHLRRVAGGATVEIEEDDLRLSIAGAQLKTALLRHDGHWQRPLGATPTTHILKLPMGVLPGSALDLRDSVANEWLCARIVSHLGLPAATCDITTFEDQKVLVVERFDRRLSPDRTWWMRRPQEDTCQSLGVPPSKKYESDGGPGIAAIMNLLDASENALEDKRTFFAAQIVFWLLAAIDGHGKNFSIFIEPAARFRLTPLYDVLSALPMLGASRGIHPRKAKLAMAFRDRGKHYELSRIQRRHMNATAKACGFAAGAEPILARLFERIPSAIERVAAEFPPDFPSRVAEPILHGLAERAKLLEEMPKE